MTEYIQFTLALIVAGYGIAWMLVFLQTHDRRES